MTKSHPRVYRALTRYLNSASAIEIMLGVTRGHRDAVVWARTLCWAEMRRRDERRRNTQETAT